MEGTLNYKSVVANIRKELKTYLVENNLKSLVLGVSGGIDSALCAALAKPVCDELGIKLIGRSLPMNSNSKEEVKRAKNIGEIFCDDFKEDYNMESVYSHTWSALKEEGWDLEDPNEKIRQGNVKARMRMIYLYDLAQLYNGMVLSTDNWTEYLLGFWTLNGDEGDFGMVQSLWKSEVYDMAEYLVKNELSEEEGKALQECIDCQATDGLGITNTDLDQILPDWEGDSRTGYQTVDLRLAGYTIDGVGDLEDPIIKRHLATEYKRNNPYNIPRNLIVS